MSRIVVTGATGNLGRRVATRLAASGNGQLLLVRDPARAPTLPGAAVARASFTDGALIRAAIEPDDTVLMVSAGEDRHRVAQHAAFVDAVVSAGAGRLVYVSFVGGRADATFTLVRDHWATEQYIRGTGIPFTFLRDNLYADFLPMMVGGDGVIRGPAGSGRAAVVAQDDIADVAAAVLRSPADHEGATYQLTGPEALTMAEIAAVIATSSGRSVTFHDESLDEAFRSRAAYGAPDWQVEAWVSTYTAIAKGELEAVSDDIERIAGHPATSLADLLAR